MARKPNYSFERKERERIKAEKKAKRVAGKKASREKEFQHSELAAKANANKSENSPTE